MHALTAQRLLKQHRFLSKIDENEINPLVNLLLEVFTSEEITENISILNLNILEVEQRIDELKSFEVTDPKCLLLSQKCFEKYLEELKNSKDR